MCWEGGGHSNVNARLVGRLELEKLVRHVKVMILVLDEQMAAPVRRSDDDDRLAGSQHQIAARVFRKRALHNPRLGIAKFAVAGHRVGSTGRQRRRSLQIEPEQ